MNLFTASELRFHPLAVARHRALFAGHPRRLRRDGHARPAARRRLLRRHDCRPRLREADESRKPCGPRSSRCRATRLSRATARRRITRSWSGSPQREGAEQGAALSEGAQAVLAAVEKAGLGAVRGAQHRNRRAGGRRGSAAQRRLGDRRLAHCDHRVHRDAVPAELRRRHRSSRRSTTSCHAGVPRRSSVTSCRSTSSPAMLTMVGYSVNDMIVIFDRVRENMRAMRARQPLDKVINNSVNQTLARTVITVRHDLPARFSRSISSAARCCKVSHSRCWSARWRRPTRAVFIAPSIAIMLSGRQAAARDSRASRASA